MSTYGTELLAMELTWLQSSEYVCHWPFKATFVKKEDDFQRLLQIVHTIVSSEQIANGRDTLQPPFART
jgi:hypothetical protein